MQLAQRSRIQWRLQCISQATKRDMCVPFFSAGSITSSVQLPTVGWALPATRTCKG